MKSIKLIKLSLISLTLVLGSANAEPNACSSPTNDGVLQCFLPNKSTLRSYHRNKLKASANSIKQVYLGGRDIRKIHVTGYGVRYTTSAPVTQTALERARTVKTALVSELGKIGFYIDDDRVVVKGIEDTAPPFTMDTQNGRALNRRVVINVDDAPTPISQTKLNKKLNKVRALIKNDNPNRKELKCLVKVVKKKVQQPSQGDCYVNAMTRLRYDVALPPLPACVNSLTDYVTRAAKGKKPVVLYRRLKDIESRIGSSINGIRVRLLSLSQGDGVFNPVDQLTLLHSQECSFGRFFLREADKKNSPYRCYSEAIKANFSKVCDA